MPIPTIYLFSHYQNLIKLMEDGEAVDVIYLDFTKAFDKVDHGVLLLKVRQLGICGRLLLWLRSFLSERRQKVAVDELSPLPMRS